MNFATPQACNLTMFYLDKKKCVKGSQQIYDRT